MYEVLVLCTTPCGLHMGICKVKYGVYVEFKWSRCGVNEVQLEWMWSKWSPSGVQVGVWGSVKYSMEGTIVKV